MDLLWVMLNGICLCACTHTHTRTQSAASSLQIALDGLTQLCKNALIWLILMFCPHSSINRIYFLKLLSASWTQRFCQARQQPHPRQCSGLPPAACFRASRHFYRKRSHMIQSWHSVTPPVYHFAGFFSRSSLRTQGFHSGVCHVFPTGGPRLYCSFKKNRITVNQ